MADQLLQVMLDRAKQPTPISDTVGRTEVPQEAPQIPQQESHAPSEVTALNPYLTSLLGGLTDTASTYGFLKRGTATEDNALVAGLSKSPGKMAALGVGANVAIPLLLKHTLGKKWPKLAEAVAANQGALQMGYGSLNTQNTMTPGSRQDPMENRNTADMYRSALISQLRGAK